MKNFLVVLNIVALALIGVLFYLHFSGQKTATKSVAASGDSSVLNTQGAIAYFEMDSVENQYEYVKDVLQELKAKENSIARELGNMEANMKKRLNELNQKGPTMTQSEGEAAQRELYQMEQAYHSRKQVLEQEFFNHNEKLKAGIKKEIENFLQEYNRDKGYAYIVANEPGLIYLKDTTHDITADLLQGLNSRYKKKN
ncbi:MAG TPA: OmpH family outer membrane protein [Parasegetibacter sp.]|jgi:outer membrane protein